MSSLESQEPQRPAPERVVDEMITSRAQLQHQAPFSVVAESMLEHLQSVLSRVVGALPNRPSGATALAEAMNLQFGLARKIWRFLEDEDVFVGGRNVPGRPGFKLFFEAAAALGIDATLIEEARRASEEFIQVVQEQAGDRNTFDIMLATHAKTNDPRAEIELRRQAFRSNGYILGVHCSAIFCRYILAPSDRSEEHLDVVGNVGFIGLKRLRPSVPWRILRSLKINARGEPQPVGMREPLFPLPDSWDSRDVADLPLMVDYCSSPLPRIERIPGRSERSGYQFSPAPAGMQGTVTCMLGEIFRADYSRYADPESPPSSSFRVPVRTPAEAAIFELLAHRDVLQGQTPRFEIFSDLFDELPLPFKLPGDRLHTNDRPLTFPSAASLKPCPEVPGYAELTQRTFERLGWSPDAFVVIRVQIAYPPVPTTMYYEYERYPRDSG